MLLLLIGCFQIEENEWIRWTGDMTTNALPQVSSVEITPKIEVYNDTTLNCSATASDADDELVIDYSWMKDSELIGSDAAIDLEAQVIQPRDVITCIAAVTDSQGAEAADSASITIENRLPSIDTLSLTESNPEVNESIDCLISTSDPDGDELTTSYSWERDEDVLGQGASLDLSTISVEVGDIITCRASVDDGYGGGDSASVALEIRNTPPEISQVEISPQTTSIGDTLTCSASGTDLNDGELIPTYLWTNGQTEIGTEQNLELTADIASMEDLIQCLAMVTDAQGESASSSETIMIGNATPQFTTGIAITPSTGVFVGVQVSCAVEAADAEDGPLNPIFSWTVNGVDIASGVNYTVLDIDTNMGDVLGCTATISDSQGLENTTSTSVVIDNTPPEITAVNITPATIYNDSILSCSATIIDPDETLSASDYTIDWRKSIPNGWVAFGPTNPIDLSSLGSFIPSPGDFMLCAVEVQDSQGVSVTAELSIEVQNRAPTSPQVSISWTQTGNNPDPSASNDLTCAASGSTDADGDTLSYSYEWTSSTASIASDFLNSSNTTTGDMWSCTVQVTDGTATATTTETIQITPTISWNYCDAGQDLADSAYHFEGPVLGANAGYSVASAGDVDGDGLDDILIGAPGLNSQSSGHAYLFLGSSMVNNQNLSQPDYAFVGEGPGDEFGYSVASAGDVDGDGLDDILIGAPNHLNESGRIYLMLGSSLGVPGAGPINANTADYKIQGEYNEDQAGKHFSSAGDIDGDNLDDLLFGVPGHASPGSLMSGKAYLMLGVSLGADSFLNLGNSDYHFTGQSSHNSLGASVASAGDVNGDGFDDILIGETGYDDGANQEIGRVGLFYGGNFGLFITQYDFSQAEYTFVGQSSYSFAGSSVSSAGDVDEDGLDDILIGSYAHDGYSGAAYLVSSTNLQSLPSQSEIALQTSTYKFFGESADDYAGYSVSSAGDVDNDGIPDILVGAYGYNTDRGRGYLYLGSSLEGAAVHQLSNADYIFTGDSVGDNAGFSVNGGGDFNGDGLPDILIGVPQDDPVNNNAGSVGVFVGCE